MRDNPPAFPLHPGVNPDWGVSAGMSLRDYFAARVVSQCIRNSLSHDGSWVPENVAYHAYLVADAMLIERAKPSTVPGAVA